MVGPGIWGETLKNVQNEKHTHLDLGNRKKTNVEQETHTHCRTWNMARKLNKNENKKLTL